MNQPHRISTSLFFALTFGLSWGAWAIGAYLSTQGNASAARLFHYAGGLMPFLVTMVLVYTRQTPDFQRDFWVRVVDLRRIGGGWVAVIFLIVPVLTALGAILDALLGGKGLVLEAAGRFVEQPWGFLPFALFMLVFGPVPEELAWRGYALGGLRLKWNALTASLVLGIAWTVWHLPLFFIQGSYQHGLGLGTPRFWLYMLDKVPMSVVMTWIYSNTQRSTLSAILLHFMVNLTGELFGLTLRAEAIYILLWMVVAGGVTLQWGPDTLVGNASGG